MSCSRLSYLANKNNQDSPDMISSAQKKNLDLFRTSASTQGPCLKNRSNFQRQYSGVDKITTRPQPGDQLPNDSTRQETKCRACVTKCSVPSRIVSPDASNNVCVVAPEQSCNTGAGRSCGRVSGSRSYYRSEWGKPRQTTKTATTNNECRSGCRSDASADDACVMDRYSDVPYGGHLIIGTCVLIDARPDTYRPAGQTQPQQILAVVMYVTRDGFYKLGTRKGAIGKMFARDEMTLSIKTGLTLNDVPDKTINMLEASTMSF